MAPGRFDDRWLCERLLYPDPKDGAEAVMSLYKDKTIVESVSALETLYTVVADTRAATNGDASVERNLRELFGLDPGQVASYREESLLGRVPTTLAFNHCWALRPWADHLLPGRSGRTVILHFDAHDDLAAPMAGITDAGCVFSAPVGESILDLRDGSSIEEFVLRGFVGIGSFIAPLLHAVAKLDIVHVSREHPEPPEDFEIVLETILETTFTGRSLRRPCVRLAPPSDDARFRYTRTCDLNLAFGRAAGRDWVLDVDLDYFCNAFDNKRREDLPVEQPSIDETARLLEDLRIALKAHGAVPSLATIALSPGFFPSDQWSMTVPRLREIVSHL